MHVQFNAKQQERELIILYLHRDGQNSIVYLVQKKSGKTSMSRIQMLHVHFIAYVNVIYHFV